MRIVIDKLGFGPLNREALTNIFKHDARTSSKLMEHVLAQNLSLEVVVGDKDHDLISKDGVKYEVKAFSKYGCNFSPSMLIGDKGLSVSIKNSLGEEAYREHKRNNTKKIYSRASKLKYIIYDMTKFPVIEAVIIEGRKLARLFPSGKVSPTNRSVIFG